MLYFFAFLFVCSVIYFIHSRTNEPSPTSTFETIAHFLSPWVLPLLGIVLAFALAKEGWPEIGIVLGYVMYMYLVTYCSREPYFEVGSWLEADRTKSSIRPSLHFLLRTGIFVSMAIIVLMRAHLVFWMFHNSSPSLAAEIGLTVVFSLLVAFWPATSVYFLFYCVFLVHLRCIFLLGVAFIGICRFVAMGAIYAVVVCAYMMPIAIYVCVGGLGFAFAGQGDARLMKSGFFIAGIALFMMSVRWAYSIVNSIRTTLSRPIESIRDFTSGVIQNWKLRCQSAYDQTIKIPIRLGDLMGGDVT